MLPIFRKSESYLGFVLALMLLLFIFAKNVLMCSSSICRAQERGKIDCSNSKVRYQKAFGKSLVVVYYENFSMKHSLLQIH